MPLQHTLSKFQFTEILVYNSPFGLFLKNEEAPLQQFQQQPRRIIAQKKPHFWKYGFNIFVFRKISLTTITQAC